MIKVLSVILVVVITLTSAPLSGFLGIELPEWFDFSINANADSNYQLLGDAKEIDTSCIELTPASAYKVGGVWYKEKVNISNSVQIEFSFFAAGGRSSTNYGADGMVLQFSNTGYSLGTTGGTLGFSNDSVLGVEFDSHPNTAEPSTTRHVAVVKDHVNNHLKTVTEDRVDDGQWHDAKITLAGEKISVAIDGEEILSYIGIDCLESEVYVGVSASTGGGYNRHLIKDFKISVGEMQISKYNSSTNDIVIEPKDGSLYSKFVHLYQVKCITATTEYAAPSGEFTIPCGAEIESLTLSKDEYQDYIIPSDVIASWKSVEVENVENSRPSYSHDALMLKDRKNGRPYVSTVFGREGINAYENIRTSSIEIQQDKFYDIIISAGNLGGKDCTYYIEQDENHRIENTTGYFYSTDLYSVLEYGKKCYAYVKTSDGIHSELVELSLTRAKSEDNGISDFFANSTFNLLGGDFAKFTIPKSVPLIGEAEISLEAFKFPAGFEIDGDSVKISIGANVFEYGTELKKNSETKYKKWSSECFSDWKDLVEGKTVSEAISDTKKSHKTALDEYKKAKENFASKWGGKCKREKSKNWNIEVLGYIDATIVNGQWVVKEANLSVGGKFTFKYTQQGAVWVIPAYVYAEMSAYLGGSTNIVNYVTNSEIPFQWTWSLKFEPKIELGAGAGVKDFASAGVYANATAPVVFNITKSHLKWDLTGEIGVEAQFCILKAKKTILDGTVNLVDRYWDTSTNVNNMYGSGGNLSSETEITVVERDYLENTSSWLGNIRTWSRLRSIAQNGLSLTELQTSVFNEAAPQVVSFGDKMLMTWVEDDATRDTYNRMRLMYSIYSDGTWCEPLPVCDDGRNDMLPVIETDGVDVYFAWQKINQVVTEDNATIENLVANTEIYMAKYDSTTNAISETVAVSDDASYDYAHNISIVDGIPVCYWATCVDNDMHYGANNTINRYEFGGKPTTVASNMNYIISLDGDSIDGTESISYSVDGDGDTSTIEDVEVFTLLNGETTVFEKDDETSIYTKVLYGKFDGKQTLFVSDMNNIYYMHNGKLKSVLSENTAISGNFNYVIKDNIPYLFWTQKEEVGNAVYSSGYENGAWTTPIKVSDTGTQLSSVDIVVYNNELRGVCTSNELACNEDNETYDYVQTNLCSLKIGEIEDLSVDEIYIDEARIKIGEETNFQIHLTNNSTKTIGNVTFEVADTLGYSTTVTKEVNLTSGEGCFVDLSYTAPENYAKTTLSVTAACDEIYDSSSDNDTARVVVGASNLVLTESEIHRENGNYLITAMLTNESDAEVNNITISAFNDDTYETSIGRILVETIGARETVLVDFVVSEDSLIVDEETNTIKIFFNASNDDKSAISVSTCFIINNIVETFTKHSSIGNAAVVDALIAEIPETITIENIEQIRLVEEEYNKLSDLEKAQLKNEEALLIAIQTADTIEAAIAFDEKVLKISQMDGDISEFVTAALEEYNELTDEVKSYVTNYELLESINAAQSGSEYFKLGLGIEQNPYLITTPELLNHVRDYPSFYYELGNDIDLSAFTDWIPIDGFSGNLNGNDYSIYNLTSTQGGLIDALSGTINNVHLKDVNINYAVDMLAEIYVYPESIGSLANSMTSDAQVLYCSTEGNISAEAVTYVGGLIGKNANGTIRYSYADVSIIAVAINEVSSVQYIGGLIGYTSLNSFGGSGKTYDCYSTGTIVTNSTSNYCGGLIGYLKTGLIVTSNGASNCLSYMNFEGNGNNGGFIGYLSSNKWKYSNCYYVPTDNVAASCGNYNTETATACTSEQLASGEIAYALQNAREETVWGQDAILTQPFLTSNSDYQVHKISFQNDSSVLDEQYYFDSKELYIPNVTPWRIKNPEADPIEYYAETDYKFIGWYDENGVKFDVNYKATSDVIFNAAFEALKVIPNDTSILIIDDENGIVSGIEINNNYAHILKENLNEDVFIRIYHNNMMLADDSLLSTGDIIQVVSKEGNEIHKEYQLAVTGDVDGDALANISDYEIIVAVSTCMQVLETPYNVAADMNFDGAVDGFDAITLELMISNTDSTATDIEGDEIASQTNEIVNNITLLCYDPKRFIYVNKL